MYEQLVAELLVWHDRWVGIAAQLQNASRVVAPLQIDNGILARRLIHSRSRDWAVLEAWAKDLEQLVDHAFVGQPVVGHLHRWFMLVTVADCVGNQLEVKDLWLKSWRLFCDAIETYPFGVSTSLVGASVKHLQPLVLEQSCHCLTKL